jgi:hypothetical protein
MRQQVLRVVVVVAVVSSDDVQETSDRLTI